MKIYFTTETTKSREGLTSYVPGTTALIEAGTVEEIQGEGVLETVPDLHGFMEECYRLLRPGSKAIFSAPYYASNKAWASPFTKRGLSEMSLNFCSKNWREVNKFAEAIVLCDFQVDGQVAIEAAHQHRSDEARVFFMGHYNNIVQALLFTLTKL